MEERIEEIMVRVCGSRQVLEPGIDLWESGLFDSLAMIVFLEELEDMGIEIQPTQVGREQFHTLEGILALVREHTFEQM